MTDIENKILNIVDEDIRVLFSPDNFILSLPLQMQIARALKKLIPILEKQVEKGSQCPDDSC